MFSSISCSFEIANDCFSSDDDWKVLKEGYIVQVIDFTSKYTNNQTNNYENMIK